MNNNSVGSAIEKIKLLEQDNEAKLKEKREYEAKISSLNRLIRETIQQIDKSEQERAQLETRVDSLLSALVLARARRDALVAQVHASQQELDELRATSDHGIMNVWKLRSSLCSKVHEVAEECDIQALLIKPMQPDIISSSNTKIIIENDNPQVSLYEERLAVAIQRKEKAICERDRLLAEPDVGEEFVRKCFRASRPARRFCSKVEESIENKPIKFSTSPAAQKTTVPVMRRQVEITMPWYQPYSVVGSVTVFLIYFCVLREENDVDLEFNKTLYDRIKGLEKEQLLQTYRFNKEHGKSVTDVEQRLKELEAEENKLLA